MTTSQLSKNNEVILLVSAGFIGMATIRRVSVGRLIVLADYSEENARTAAHSQGEPTS